MKSILISIKPEFVAKIINGEKTIEVRKTAPKCNLPIDVYIYCTKGGALYILRDMQKEAKLYGTDLSKKCYKAAYEKRERKTPYKFDLSGHVVAKFTLRKVEEIRDQGFWYETDSMKGGELALKSCLNTAKLHMYLTKCETTSNENNMASVSITFGGGYAWHISDLVIFDEPKVIWQMRFFSKPKKVRKIGHYDILESKQISKAPQSWCFTEDKK